MLIPSKVKHRKWTKTAGMSSGVETRAVELAFGEFGLKAMKPGLITSRQIEAARRAILRYLKKGGKIWIRVFPDKPRTKKGTEVPMGGGKGGVDHYVFYVRPGRILFELDGVSEDIASEALRNAADKLSMKTRFIKRT